jgi:DNA mismatch endonuclease, patch repair protein
MDRISPEIRSKNMSRIRSKNTVPELMFRKALYNRGYRYRIHFKLPGRPDVVFVSKRLVIFIHGCFWHGHDCKLNHIPKTHSDFWKNKVAKNRERDALNILKLKESGWQVLVFWECEILTRLEKVLKKTLSVIEVREGTGKINA